MEMVLNKVNQNVQEAIKKFQDNKNKKYEKQKQITEFIGTLNKYQSETENIMNREINELRTKIDNIKEEVAHDWKTSEERMKHIYKANGMPFQQTRTSRRQNLRT
jgi:uncharacterized protein Yka (UPF0111/DUF47 family)